MTDPAIPFGGDFARRDPTYLGDGVYAAHDGLQIWLRANNADWHGSAAMADIALEPVVLVALLVYAQRTGLLPKVFGETS